MICGIGFDAGAKWFFGVGFEAFGGLFEEGGAAWVVEARALAGQVHEG